MLKHKTASGIFLAAILLYAGIAMAQQPTTSILSKRPTIDLTFKVHASAQQLEVQWFAPAELQDFILRVQTDSGITQEIPFSGQTHYFLEGIDPNAQFEISVVAVDAAQNEIAYSPVEKWPGLAERMRLGKQAGAASPLAANLNAILNSIDSNNFPFIFTAVSIDTNNQPVGTLTKSNFAAFEDNRLQTDFFDVTPPSIGGGVRIVDFVFVIDNSGSMGPEQQAVKDNVKAFVDSLIARNINVQLGLVRFGQGANGGEPIVVNNGNLTGNVTQFKNFLDQMTTDGGFEPGIRAVNAAATSFTFRPGSQRHFLLITDEDSDGGNLAQTISTCLSNGITVHSAVDCNFGTANRDYCVANTSIRGGTGGLLFNVIGPYNQILILITTKIGNTYIVRYRTDNQNCDGLVRKVQIAVNAFSEIDTVTAFYTPCAAPTIRRTQPTIDLSKAAQVAGTALTIEAEITDAAAPFVQSASCFYRTTGASAYKSIIMSPIGNNIYRAIIPGVDVQTPGVDYFLTATDGQVTSSNPSVDPGTFPHQIAVLPNTPPLITHTPIRTAPPTSNVVISCTVIDNTNFLTTVELRYREFGTLLFKTINMANLGSNQFEATIPGSDVTTSGIEYFIRAVDNFGLSATHGVHLIQVGGGGDCTQNFSDNFDDGAADGWIPNKTSRWTVRQVRGSNAYCLDVANSTGDEWSTISAATWGDFVLDLDAESTLSGSGKNYFILFGTQSVTGGPANAYYLQFRDGAVNLFRSVNNSGVIIASTPIDFVSDNQRHHVKVQRTGANIKVFADGQSLFEVNDSVFGDGYIGVGVFKGTACFDNVVMTGSSQVGIKFSDDFDDGNANGWSPQTQSRWDVSVENGSQRYFLNTSQYDSPDGARLGELSLIDNLTLGDFIFECLAKSWDAPIGTRGADLCIVFGYQDGFNYYYAMYNSAVSLTAIHRVQAGVRTELATYAQPTFTDGAYYPLRVERTGNTINTYFNGNLILTANDNVFGAGQFGVGSFNDSGYFDNIVISEPGCVAPQTSTVNIPDGMKVAAGSMIAVPIIVSTTEDIGLAQFTVEYDSNVLQFSGSATIGPDAPGFSVSQINSSPPFPPSTPGTNSNLIVSISGGGGNAFTDIGKTVVLLNFLAAGSVGDTTVLAFDGDCARTFLTTTSLKDICGAQLNKDNGSAEIILSPDVLGHVRYYDADKPVRDASVTLSGAIQQTQTTDGAGFYQFANVPAGNYTLRASKNNDRRGAISGSDALALLKAVGFLINLTPEQEKAGDVDRNNSITPSDAVAVLRYLAFLSSGTASTGEWIFEPEVASIQVSNDVTQDFTAFLLGDVTGNWGANAAVAAKAQFTSLNIDEAFMQDDTLSLPLRVPDEAATIYTVVASLQWETEIEKNVKFIPSKSGVYFALNTTDPAKTHLALACLDGFQAGEKVGELVVQIPETGNDALQHVATVTSLQVNDRTLQERNILLTKPAANIPEQFELYQNYPNPFNINTTIRFGVPKLEHQQEIVLEIYSLTGQLVRRLYKGEAEPGFHTANWDGRDETGKIVGTGLYFYRLRSGAFAKSAKLLLVK